MNIKNNLSVKDKIALCGVVILGRGVAETAYLLSHTEVKTNNKNSLSVMVSRWLHDSRSQEFIKQVQTGTATTAITDNQNDLTTREGLIEELVKQTRVTVGKESISGLQTLAKLQGFDRLEDKDDTEERRTYFLPWVSNCRTCKLMELYMSIQKKQG